MTLYLDTSALAKLLIKESESAAVASLVKRQRRVATSALAEVELMRVAHRICQDSVDDALAILDAMHILAVSAPIVRSAGSILPGSMLRSLDAIHLATAQAVPDLSGVCTYDSRMIDAAHQLGLHTFTPST